MTKCVIIAVAAFACGFTYNDQTPVDSTIVEKTDTTITNDDLQGDITRGNLKTIICYFKPLAKILL